MRERSFAPLRSIRRVGRNLRRLINDHELFNPISAVRANVAERVEHPERPSQKYEAVKAQRIDEGCEVVAALCEGVAREWFGRSAVSTRVDGDDVELVGESGELIGEEVC